MVERYPTKKGKEVRDKRERWERQELKRLVCALVLFLSVFLGKKIYPAKMAAVGEEVLTVLGHSIDAEEVFARLGEAVNGDETLKGLEQFCVEVFGAKEAVPEQTMEEAIVPPPAYPEAYTNLLHEELDNFFTAGTETEEEINFVPPPEVGTVLRTGAQPEQGVPEGYTMDELSLGVLETVSPIIGHLNSGFGYRDHPISGNNAFHRGVDIGASEGDPIVSFADGVVEYIGQDKTYGLYMQIDHGNEIKSFYAHCSRVCVRYGQRVAAGECVAKVGSTGRVTGPHLHFELKCCGKRVDPAYYVEFI